LFLVYALILILAALILLIDLVAAAALAVALARAVPLALRGREATGRVVKIESRRPGRTARVRVAYETPGGTLETGGTSQRPRLGEPKAVRYDPARPARATTLVRPARTAAAGIPVILVAAALSAGMITGSAWYFASVHSHARLPLAGGCFTLACALATGYYAWGQYAELLRWRRMVQAAGKVKRFNEHAPGGPGILISFESADGREEFWARAGSVAAGVGDTVTVYYDPAKPASSATVQTAADVRAHAIGGTVVALVFAAVTVMALAVI
jgi:hypothetical protein